MNKKIKYRVVRTENIEENGDKLGGNIIIKKNYKLLTDTESKAIENIIDFLDECIHEEYIIISSGDFMGFFPQVEWILENEKEPEEDSDLKLIKNCKDTLKKLEKYRDWEYFEVVN